jgi:hypothetical protein
MTKKIIRTFLFVHRKTANYKLFLDDIKKIYKISKKNTPPLP